MADDLKHVGFRIKLIRKKIGMTMEEFGKIFVPKADKSNVSRWEKNKALPSNERLSKIAELGNTTVEYLLYGKSDSYGSLSNKIKEIRVNRKETLEKFANNIQKANEYSIKTTKSNVSKWEKGLNVPNDVTLQTIANLGNTTVEELLKLPNEITISSEEYNRLKSIEQKYNEIKSLIERS